jgi:2-phosphoglycerate kinase
LSWNEVWSQPVEVLVNDEFAYYRERFPFILNDLACFDENIPLLLEGAAFLPELIDQCAINHQHVVYMVPTGEFQYKHYRQRPWIRQILETCTDPDQTFAAWMQRDVLFGRTIVSQARGHNFHLIEVDGSVSIAQQFDQVCRFFELE